MKTGNFSFGSFRKARVVTMAFSLAAAILQTSCNPASSPIIPATSAASETPRRFALVIGNGEYRSVPQLANPTNDAKTIAADLRNLGFTTDLVLDTNLPILRAAIEKLSSNASGADTALIFYAGHAVDFGGRNYLLPVEVSIKNGSDLSGQALGLDEVMESLQGRARKTLVLLDACRDDPFAAAALNPSARPGRVIPSDARQLTRSIGSGLASVSSGAGTLVAFATAPGHVALDGAGEHSPFTTALLRHIADPNVEVRQMLGNVRRDVRLSTNNEQVPWDNSSLEEAVYLNQTLPTRAKLTGPTGFDGVWHGESDIWKITMNVVNGQVFGAIDTCFSANNTRKWQPNGPPIEGSIDANGRLSATTVPTKGKEGWSTRSVSGQFPELRMTASTQNSLSCPNGAVTMHRQ